MVDNSPVPSATISRDEEIDETTETTDNLPAAAAVEEKRTQKRLRLIPSSLRSPVKDAELRDDANSSSPPHAQAVPPKACLLSSMPPAPAAGGVCFGGPGDFPSLSKDDNMFD